MKEMVTLSWIITTSTCLLAFPVAFLLLRRANRWFEKRCGNPRLITVLELAYKTSKVLLAAFGIIYILGLFGVSLDPVYHLLSMAGVGVGFGMGSLFKDIIMAVFYAIDGNMEKGDRIVLDGKEGTVSEVSLRNVTLDIGKGQILIIPYSAIKTVHVIRQATERS